MPPSPTSRPAVMFANANSRRGKQWFDQAMVCLQENGIELAQAKLFRSGGPMRRAILAAREANSPLIIVGGGDGTLHSAAGQLAHSNSVLGVLPLGTGNAFARDLGIRTEVAHACEVIANGEIAEVDLGLINGRPFLSVATIGLSTIIARSLNPNAKRFLGPIAYIRPIVLAFRAVKPFRAKVIADGAEFTFDCLQIVVGNGRFHAGPFPLSDDASLKSGELVVYAIATKDKRVLVRYLIEMSRGNVEAMPESEVFRLVSGRIETWPHRKVVVDGEPLMGGTPIDLGIAPKALKVMAPAKIPGEDQSTSS